MTLPAVDVDPATSLFITYCRAKRLAPRTLETYSASLKGLIGFLAKSSSDLPIPGTQGWEDSWPIPRCSLAELRGLPSPVFHTTLEA